MPRALERKAFFNVSASLHDFEFLSLMIPKNNVIQLSTSRAVLLLGACL